MTVAIVRKGPGFAHQPIDDVPVRDPVFATPPQARQFVHPLVPIPNLDPLGVDPGFDPLADQPTGHRVDVPLDMNGAPGVHLNADPFASLQPPGRQRLQQRHLLGQAVAPARVQLTEQLLHERRVGTAVGEIPAAPQHQGLRESPLELMVALLGVPVLVGLPRLNRLALQSVVPEQRLVTLLELLRPAPRRHGGRQAIGAVQVRHAAQLPDRVLETLTEALQTL